MLNFLLSLPKLILKLNPIEFIAIIGIALFVIRIILPILKSIWRLFLRPAKNLKKLGSWAIVTGATDGIGKAYAYELAKKGLNILLVSRTQSKLTSTQNELLSSYPSIQVRTLAIDFSQFDTAAQFQFSEAIKGLDIGILINNVGQSYEYPEYFHLLDRGTIQSIIDLNIKSTTIVTHIVLPILVNQKRGAIVNISSFAGLIVSPLLTEYSAAKAYVDKFSKGLHAEYKSKGISIQVQNPLFVSTKLAKIKHSSLTVPSPSSYAKAGLRCIGYEDQVSPYWTHAIQTAIVKLLPESIMTAYAQKLHFSIRKRALKKQQSKTE